MVRAEELLSQYQRKIGQVGQWVAIRRYSGTSGTRTHTDTATPGYVRYEVSKEFVGAVTQAELIAIVLVDALGLLLPITTNDRLLTGFFGAENLDTPPTLDVDNHISGGKESAIKSAIKRSPNGILIAIEIHAVG
jgi:hypothetical protein